MEVGVEVAHFMSCALEQAEKALSCGEVPVGCVFVHHNPSTGVRKIIGGGFNQTNRTKNGTRHAEMVAIDEILFRSGHRKQIFTECELYVTCEPCIMCAAAIGKLGISCVYYGCGNDRFGGNGSIMNLHNNCPGSFPYEVCSGLMRDEAINLFQKFYSGVNLHAPPEKRKRRKSDSNL